MAKQELKVFMDAWPFWGSIWGWKCKKSRLSGQVLRKWRQRKY